MITALSQAIVRRWCAYAGVHVTGTEYVDRGAAIQLVCNATGRPDPPHNVDWYKVHLHFPFSLL